MLKKNIKGISLMILISLVISGCAGLKLLAPKHQALVNTLEPTFKWKYASKQDLSFELKIALDHEFTKNVKLFKISEVMSFKLTIPYLKPGQKYYWTVKANYFDKNEDDFISSDWAYKDKKNKINKSVCPLHFLQLLTLEVL